MSKLSALTSKDLLFYEEAFIAVNKTFPTEYPTSVMEYESMIKVLRENKDANIPSKRVKKIAVCAFSGFNQFNRLECLLTTIDISTSSDVTLEIIVDDEDALDFKYFMEDYCNQYEIKYSPIHSSGIIEESDAVIICEGSNTFLAVVMEEFLESIGKQVMRMRTPRG